MTRYFYTDPLGAAWMMTTHGMECTNKCGVLLASVGIGLVLDYANRNAAPLVYHPSSEPVYIHADSLGLLEPHDGDILVWEHDGYIHTGPQGVTPMKTSGIGIFPILRTDAVHGGRFSFRIIQRNGLPFHWPEREAA